MIRPNDGAVTGNGGVTIHGGTANFLSGFEQNVSFNYDGTVKETLVLAQSQSYTGTVSGLLIDAPVVLDLRDIGFVGSGEATFSGTNKSGILTVTDGTHTAQIALTGHFINAKNTIAFIASSDGAGGVDIDAQTIKARHANIQPLVSAMAGLVAGAGGAVRSPILDRGDCQVLLAPPRTALT